MSQWTPVASNARKERKAKLTMSEAEVTDFLSRFKTRNKCTKEIQAHDIRSCPGFHSDVDRRRNPYEEYYDYEDCVNQTERLYHPIMFRTYKCRSPLACELGDFCAHAHTTDALRDQKKAKSYYERLDIVPVRPLPNITSYLPSDLQNINYTEVCFARWDELRTQGVKVETYRLRLDDFKTFVVEKSNALLGEIERVAFKNGLGLVEKKVDQLVFKGINMKETISQVRRLLEPPSRYFSVFDKKYTERVISALKKFLQGSGQCSIANSEYALIKLLSENKIRICGVSSKKQRGGDLVREVIDKIDFWVLQEGYDKLISCGCCFDDRNFDQGVTCRKGHFFCSIENCFERMIALQVLHLAKREQGLLCPVCNETYDMQEVAKHLPKDTWQQVEKALVDKQVEKQTETLQKEFNHRLQEKVQEFMNKYGNAEERIKMQAQSEALSIRNTILNLSCPHCGVAYAEFDGCMALQCKTCNGNFCGYCHQKCGTGQGAHEHVRQCIMNETTNGSYYADAEEIRKAQLRYRTRRLKKHLSALKNDLQNAVVIELANDLRELGINPEALFEFGNLQY